MIPLHNKKTAFALPEALITIALMAFVALYFILSFMVSRYSTVLSKERIVVSNLLRGEMENVLASNYDSISPVTQNITVDDGTKSMAIAKTINVNTEDTDTYGYKKVYVKMEWTGGASGNRALKEEAVMYVTKE